MSRFTFPKNKRDTLVIERTEYKGSAIVNLRLWYMADGELRPTVKGISISLSLLPDIIQALQKIQREVEIERGAGHA